MFRSSSLASMPTYKLILGFGLCTLGGAMLYAYFKTSDKEEEGEEAAAVKDAKEHLRPREGQRVKKLTNGIQKKSPKKDVTIKLAVSNEHIPLIAGRGGVNLVMIEEKTQTVIKFREKNETQQYCDITGSPDAVKQARALILKEIERSPTVKEEIYVPAAVCGKIIGRCGEAMQEICRISMAKVSVDTGGRCGGGGMDKRRITITGNRQQVNFARKLLEEKIQENEDVRRAVEEVEQHREPRRSPSNSISSSMYSSQASLSSSHLPPREKLIAAANSDDKRMEVYISASASPSKFWVQLIGPQSKRLDELVQTMTDYYSIAENRQMHHIEEPYLGQIVATVFKNDGKWYRAEIVGILPNQYNPDEVVLDLYFVDYGDSEYVRPHEVFELRTDFLTLRFQAVECFLANIKSTLPTDSDCWEITSIQKFEELTQVGNWKRLISRVITYKERSKTVTNATGQSAATREGSPIPGVELYDPIEGVEVNIGHLLISHGFALPAEDQQLRSPYFMSRKNSTHLSNESLTGMNAAAINNANSVENSLIEQQLEHLQRNNNLYLNENNGSREENLMDQRKFSPDLFNGNFTTPPPLSNNAKHTEDNLLWNSSGSNKGSSSINTLINGNLSR